jgi:hypothetical protein
MVIIPQEEDLSQIFFGYKWEKQMKKENKKELIILLYFLVTCYYRTYCLLYGDYQNRKEARFIYLFI